MKIKSVKVIPHQEVRRKYGHAYFFQVGESLSENLQNRRSRPSKEYKKLLPEACKQAGIDPFTFLASWSQKCGCSCGCSPGFRLQGHVGSDIFIDVE
jgi:hypothetical protein